MDSNEKAELDNDRNTSAPEFDVEDYRVEATDKLLQDRDLFYENMLGPVSDFFRQTYSMTKPFENIYTAPINDVQTLARLMNDLIFIMDKSNEESIIKIAQEMHGENQESEQVVYGKTSY